MRRPSTLLRTPAVIALAAVFVLSLVGLQGLSRVIAEGYDALNSWGGEAMSEADMLAMNEHWAMLGALGQASGALGVLAAASALALVFVWCFWPRGARPTEVPTGVQSSEDTRTMSAAGSTVNLAETTVPNSSPSISNSSAPSPISMSTERPRE